MTRLEQIPRVARVELDGGLVTWSWEVMRPDGTRAGGYAPDRGAAYARARDKLREWSRDQRKDRRANGKRRPRRLLPWESR